MSPRRSRSDWRRWRSCLCAARPAERCDFDHTVPWPLAPTHASGGLYCRTHHLIKTFYAGFGGWADKIPR